MSSQIIQAIDSSPLLRLLGECLMAAPGMLARGANAMLDGAVELGGGAMSFAKSTASMGSSIFSGPSGPEISPVRTPEISAPAVEPSRFHVAMEDLGQFSAPTFGGGSIGGKGFGIG